MMDNTLDLLLQLEPLKGETTQVKIKRLSKLAGGDIIFQLKTLGCSRVAELKELTDPQDVPIQAILAGAISPHLKSAALMEKYKVATPADLIRSMLTPGEIEDLYRKIQKLSGYLTETLEEVKKNRLRPRGAVDVLLVSKASYATGRVL
ncbi:MAG: hypothetical protein VB100_10370 [Angelakisella sp.]|nr:hypothetical protein [Angelakisella sp.]